jgi:ketosteroid isomerase-like protein
MTQEDRINASNAVELVRAVIVAFNENDIEAIGRWVAPDYTYTIRGRSVVSGVYHGWEELARALNRIKELTAGTMAGFPEVVVANDDSVMMYARVTGSRPDGRIYDSYQAYLYRFRDGKAVEGQTIPVDQQAFAEFLA